jgi:hypothetical protein
LSGKSWRPNPSTWTSYPRRRKKRQNRIARLSLTKKLQMGMAAIRAGRIEGSPPGGACVSGFGVFIESKGPAMRLTRLKP